MPGTETDLETSHGRVRKGKRSSQPPYYIQKGDNQPNQHQHNAGPEVSPMLRKVKFVSEEETCVFNAEATTKRSHFILEEKPQA